MGATVTTVFPLYKEHYLGNNPEIFFTSKKLTSPVLAAMESKSLDDGGGRAFVIPVIDRLSGAIGATFSRAQTAARSTNTNSTFGADRWEVAAIKSHGVATFSHDSILAAKGDSDKMLDVIKTAMETTTMALRKRLAHYVTGGGWGKVATILAVDATTVTIDPALCNRVQEGDSLVACADENASVIRNITGTDEVEITAVARRTGVLTLGADPTGGTAWAVGDILFRAGDRQDSATPARQVICGLDGWFSEDTTLHAVTRTGKAELIALQVDGAGKDHSQASVEALERLFQYDSYGSVQYVSPTDYSAISLDKDATKVVSMEVGKYKIGFEGLMASWQGYTVPILPDAMIDPGKSYVGPFDDDDWAPFLACNGELVNINDEDGMDVRAVDGSDNFEARLYSRGNVICPAPGKFCRISSFGL